MKLKGWAPIMESMQSTDPTPMEVAQHALLIAKNAQDGLVIISKAEQAEEDLADSEQGNG
jgi:hypothetical protein